MYACSPKWDSDWIGENDLETVLSHLTARIKPSPLEAKRTRGSGSQGGALPHGKSRSKAERILSKISSHQLRHTMATQLLNADMDLVSIQDLLGHERVGTTEKYIKVSNIKVMRDYFKATEVVTKGSADDVSSSR